MGKSLRVGGAARSLVALVALTSLASLPAVSNAQGYFYEDTSAACPSPAYDFQYLGCYEVTANPFLFSPRDYTLGQDETFSYFEYHQNNNVNNTITAHYCSRVCRGHGYKYASLRDRACSCGSTLDYTEMGGTAVKLSTVKLADNDAKCTAANDPCPGDRRDQCGTGQAALIYVDPSFESISAENDLPAVVAGYTQLGCFEGPNFPTDKATITSPPTEFNTAADCMSYCADLGSPLLYMGHAGSGKVRCFCGAEFGKNARGVVVNDNTCSTSCANPTSTDKCVGQDCCGPVQGPYPVYINPDLVGCFLPRIPGVAEAVQGAVAPDAYTCFETPEAVRNRATPVLQIGAPIAKSAKFVPTAKPGTNAFSIYGCYSNYYTNDVFPPGAGRPEKVPTNGVNVENCIEACDVAGYSYAILSGKPTKCYCSNTGPAPGYNTEGVMQNCNQPCPASDKENCGGENGPLVYAKSDVAAVGPWAKSFSATYSVPVTYSCTPTDGPDGPDETPGPSGGPSGTPTPSDGPNVTPAPSGGPDVTPTPSAGPNQTPLPSGGPDDTPLPSGGPDVTPLPSGSPDDTPLPSGDPDITPLPSNDPDITPLPSGDPDITPLPSGGPDITPLPSGGPEVTPLPSGGPDDTPLPSGEPDITPLPSSGPDITPLPSGGPDETPLPSGGPDITPLPSGGPDITPLPSGGPDDTPLPSGGPDETPAPSGGPDETPLSSGGPDETALPSGGPDITPLPSGGPDITPLPSGGPDITPLSSGGPDDTPLPSGGPDETPLPSGSPDETPLPSGGPDVTPSPSVPVTISLSSVSASSITEPAESSGAQPSEPAQSSDETQPSGPAQSSDGPEPSGPAQSSEGAQPSGPGSPAESTPTPEPTSGDGGNGGNGGNGGSQTSAPTTNTDAGVTTTASSSTSTDNILKPTPTIQLASDEVQPFGDIFSAGDVPPGTGVLALLQVFDPATGAFVTVEFVVIYYGCFEIPVGASPFNGNTTNYVGDADAGSTAASCAGYCAFDNLPLSANNAGDCFCGDQIDLGALTEAPDREACSNPCPGDPSQKCGGGSKLRRRQVPDSFINIIFVKPAAQAILLPANNDSSITISATTATTATGTQSAGPATTTGTNTGAPSGTETGASSGTETASPSGIETGAPSGTETGTPSGTEPGAPSGTETGTPSGTELGSPSGTESGAPSGTETGAPSGMETGAPSGTDTGAPGGTNTGVPSGTNTGITTGTDGMPTVTNTGIPSGNETMMPTGTDSTAPSGTATGIPGVTDLPEAFLLGVAPGDADSNTKRGVANLRRQAATGGFVGAAGPVNPDDCTDASLFNLEDGQLVIDEVPVATNPNIRYMPLRAAPGSISTTFSIANGILRWSNVAFLNGEAGFCQDPTGQVYITFEGEDTWPIGCEVVSLVAYAASQCQDGEIVPGSPTTLPGGSGGASATSAMPTFPLPSKENIYPVGQAPDGELCVEATLSFVPGQPTFLPERDEL